MEVGDLIVHIGAKPSGYRVRLVVDFGEKNHQGRAGRIFPRETIVFVDGRYDWKDQWRVFNNWKNYENR